MSRKLLHIKKKKGNFQLKGYVFTDVEVTEMKVQLEGRGKGGIHQEPVSFHKKISLKEQNKYQYKAELHFIDKNKQLLKEDVYETYLLLKKIDGTEEKIKINRPSIQARFSRMKLYKYKNEQGIAVRKYFTYKAYNLAIEVMSFGKEELKLLEKIENQKILTWYKNRKKDVWLVGERPYKAQDTGYHFFKYMRTHHPDKEVYYVVEKDSIEKKNVLPFGNVLDFKSKEHIEKSFIAKKLIGSHHADYLLPTRDMKSKADKFFLQHGVMGTKYMANFYGKKAAGFKTDIFFVSSDREKEMIVNDFGYEPNEVFVTGLSRFDELFKRNVQVKNQILIIPTWRDWIKSKEEFLNSEYYKAYYHLLHSEQLQKIQETYQSEIIFCLHPNMQLYTDCFKNIPYKVINQGETDVQYLIKESAMMVTDYSSVGFDFSFLSKPVIYYQFDRDAFLGKEGSHLNLDNDLPGEIASSEDKVLDLIEEYARTNFQMKEKYKRRANTFITFKDLNASKRIYTVINNVKVKRNTLKEIQSNSFVVLVGRKVTAIFKRNQDKKPTSIAR